MERLEEATLTVNASPEPLIIHVEENEYDRENSIDTSAESEEHWNKEICDLTNLSFPTTNVCGDHRQQDVANNLANNGIHHSNEPYKNPGAHSYGNTTAPYYSVGYYDPFSSHETNNVNSSNDANSYGYNIQTGTSNHLVYNPETGPPNYVDHNESDKYPHTQANLNYQLCSTNENRQAYSHEYAHPFDQDLFEWSRPFEHRNSANVPPVEGQHYTSQNIQDVNLSEETNDTWTANSLYNYNESQPNAENSAWLQSTVNELFADSKRSLESQSPIDCTSHEKESVSDSNQVFPQNPQSSLTCELLTPPLLTNASRQNTTESQSDSERSCPSSYLFYVPMRVTRNAETGSIQMQYECLPNDSAYQPQPCSTPSKVVVPNEAVYGRKNPPKTVRELLEEYRQKLYYPETTDRYIPEGPNVSNYPSTSHQSPDFSKPEYNSERSDSNEVYSNYTEDSKDDSPVSSSTVTNDTLADQDSTNQPSESSCGSLQHFLNEASTIGNANIIIKSSNNNSSHAPSLEQEDASLTKAVQISIVESASSPVENPMTPDSAGTSISSPAQSDDISRLPQTALPGIQYIKGVSYESYFNQAIERNYDLWSSVPDFVLGPVDVKEHRPRHFEMLSLQIGVFNVVEPVENNETKKGKNKFKVLFSKRRLVYEFLWINENVDQGKKECIELACIYIPFKAIEALNITQNEVIIRVNSKPHIFSGKKQSSTGFAPGLNTFNTKREVDVTNGQLGISPVHKVVLKNNQCSKLRSFLMAFDRRFWYLLHREIPPAAYSEIKLPDYTEIVQKSMSHPSCKRILEKKGSELGMSQHQTFRKKEV